ncbi:MAG: roadblock/LC7 domain-containing protein [Thermodesulfobacteriota bacterium]|nr:MAG: roadblock/LC7 domain-containing protein [Thermodesulfobacteriota bacterium]
MAFDSILEDLSMRAGANGAILIDWDGEIVASWAASRDVNIDLIGAHHEIILDIVKEAASRHDRQDVRHLAITTDKAKLAISTVKEGYCLVVALGNERPMGKALFESKRAVERIEEEMG